MSEDNQDNRERDFRRLHAYLVATASVSFFSALLVVAVLVFGDGFLPLTFGVCAGAGTMSIIAAKDIKKLRH